jgi:hypothetical protein
MPRGHRETVKLTKRVVDALKTDDPRGDRTHDSQVKGLSVTVYPSGQRVYSLDYGPRDRRRRVTIGRHGEGDMTLDKARTEAGRLRSEVSKGNDPLDARREEREASTFEAWTGPVS